jgi:transcriptional regulator GlxA family with amidase domain
MIIGIPVYENCDILDVTGPYEMLSWGGLDVELVTQNPGLIKSGKGFTFEVTTGFAQAANYDALWVSGGEPDALARLMGDPSRAYLDFLIQKAERATYVCSVCDGALLLAAAGLLDGYEATTHWAFTRCLTDRFPKVKVVEGHPRFHLDRNRLTGGGVSSGLDEALKLIELLQGTVAAQEAQRMTQYYPCPPVTSVIPPAGPCSVPPVTIPPPRDSSTH